MLLNRRPRHFSGKLLPKSTVLGLTKGAPQEGHGISLESWRRGLVLDPNFEGGKVWPNWFFGALFLEVRTKFKTGWPYMETIMLSQPMSRMNIETVSSPTKFAFSCFSASRFLGRCRIHIVDIFDLCLNLLAKSIKIHLASAAFAGHIGYAAMNVGDPFSIDASLVV